MEHARQGSLLLEGDMERTGRTRCCRMPDNVWKIKKKRKRERGCVGRWVTTLDGGGVPQKMASEGEGVSHTDTWGKRFPMGQQQVQRWDRQDAPGISA